MVHYLFDTITIWLQHRVLRTLIAYGASRTYLAVRVAALGCPLALAGIVHDDGVLAGGTDCGLRVVDEGALGVSDRRTHFILHVIALVTDTTCVVPRIGQAVLVCCGGGRAHAVLDVALVAESAHRVITIQTQRVGGTRCRRHEGHQRHG